MSIYRITIKNAADTSRFLEYLDTNYSLIPEEVFDVDEGGSSTAVQVKYFELPESLDIDITNIIQTLDIPILPLNGNKTYNIREYSVTINDYIPLLERLLETKAKEYFFDSSVDACSYTGSDNAQFRKESLAFVAWRDQLWGPVFEQLKVDLASGPVDFDQFLSSLPSYESYLDNQTI